MTGTSLERLIVGGSLQEWTAPNRAYFQAGSKGFDRANSRIHAAESGVRVIPTNPISPRHQLSTD